MNSWINIFLGKKLKGLRERNNKKQTEMAYIFEMKQQSYSKIERGKTNFSDKILNKICEEFNTTKVEFLTVPISTTAVSKLKDNNIDDFTTAILFANYRKQMAEQKLRIAELELQLRRQKTGKIIAEDIKPIYVLI